MANTIPLKFSKSVVAGSDAVGIEITSDAPKNVWNAVASNGPLPPGDFELGRGTVRASGGTDFTLGQKGASFSASGSAYAALGVYGSPAAVSTALQIQEQDPIQIDLPTTGNPRFGVFQWGYDIRAAGKGAVALGGSAGSMSFSGQAQGEGLTAVVRLLDSTAGTRTTLQSVVESFCLPSQVQGSADISPGTWLYSEVNGSIELGVKGTFGWNFDWIRSVDAGQLIGDIGLKIALDVEASFGFKASGRYAVLVSRGPDAAAERVRVRIYKLRYKGWDFALDAGATVESSVTGLPARFDDFIATVLGTHGTQFVRDLRTLEGWVTGAPLPQRFVDAGADYVEGLIRKLAGDQLAQFETVRDRVLGALKTWDELPDRASSAIWRMIGDKVPVADIRNIANQIATANADSIKDLVDKALGDTGNPWKERLLDALSESGILDAIINNFASLQHAAGEVASILDPAGAALSILQSVHDHVSKELSVDRVRNALSQADFDHLDIWLRTKLSALVGRSAVLSDLEKVRTTIALLMKHWDEWYDKAKTALQRKYDFAFSASYSSATTRDALADVEFDLSKGPAVATALADAIDGRLGSLLTTVTPGIMVRSGVLTHSVERHGHVGLSLPFYKVDIDHINMSLAKLVAADADGERVLVYELESKDQVTEIVRGRSSRESRLALALSMNPAAVRASTGRLTYSFRSARVGMRPSELHALLAPLVETYFAGLFSGLQTGTREPFASWIADLDGRIPHVGSNFLGNTFVALELAIPERVVTAWLKAPTDRNDHLYRQMSINIQQCMRRFIPLAYFSDPEKYNGAQNEPIAALLTYASSPPIAEGDLYWDVFNPARLQEVTGSSITGQSLAGTLSHIHDVLHAAGLDDLAKQYNAGLAGVLQKACETNFGTMLVRSLFLAEKAVISEAWAAALAVATFRTTPKSDPEVALKALESFGAKLTEAFNEKMVSLYTKSALRALGPLVLIEAARVFDDSLGALEPAVSLRLAVVKAGASFPPAVPLDDYEPTTGSTVATDRLVRIA